MEKRVLIAVLLSFVVLYAYQVFLAPPATTPATATSTKKPATGAAPSATSTATTTAPANAPAATRKPITPAVPGRDVVVDNSAVHAVFTTTAGALKSWTLKKYPGTDGRPLDLVPQIVPAGTVRPFTLAVDDPGVSQTLATASFEPSTPSVTLTSGTADLRFDYRGPDGLVAEKTFRFSAAQPYVVTFSATVTRAGKSLNPTVLWGPGLGTGVVAHTRTYNPSPEPLFYRGGKVTRVTTSKIKGEQVEDGQFGFAGVDDHYFAALALNPGQVHLEYRPLNVPVPGVTDGAHFVDWSSQFASAPHGLRFFIGPKDFDVLASVDRDLVRAIDFGIFSWLVVPLLRALKWINGPVGNYGWSLIILTVLINLVMFPLRHKSVVSMRKMQEIQPEVKAIQERYAKLKMSDPAKQKMNVELMNLYRERGVNPASGCIPMLLTFPVLYAVYALLEVAIELRGAPFIWWIRDLSAPDPLFITPILMGITQFAQTKMTPAAADPTQQKMMLFMPIIFTGMFLWAPSGLVIYWTTANLWGIGQQMITNRLIGAPIVRNPRPPAERRVKPVGRGRTDQASKERS